METTTTSFVRKSQIGFLIMVAQATRMDCDKVNSKLEEKSDDYVNFMFDVIGMHCDSDITAKEMEEEINFLLGYNTMIEATMAKVMANQSKENIIKAKKEAFTLMSDVEAIKKCIEVLTPYGIVSSDSTTFDELSDKCKADRAYFNTIAYSFNEICNDGQHDAEEIKIKYGWLMDSNSVDEATSKARAYIAEMQGS